VGGCTPDAASAVCASDEVGTEAKVEPGSATAALSGLVDHSLVQRSSGEEGEARLTMLETIREFALEQLEVHESNIEAEGRATRRAHAEYYLQLVEQANQELVGPEHVSWLDRLEHEQDNLRAALAWTVDQGGAESA
jgi:hypothetical protein